MIVHIINSIKDAIPGILLIASALFGLCSAIVKACPTLPADHFLLPIIKILGKITNNQTSDEDIRQQQTLQKSSSSQPTP